MKAVVMEGPKLPLEVRDMPVPEVGPLAGVPRVMESMGSFGTVGFTTIEDFS